MRRLISFFAMLVLLFTCCVGFASAEETVPTLDYEAFYAKLTAEGVFLPATMDELLAVCDITSKPPVTITVDKENKLVTLTTTSDDVTPFYAGVGWHEEGHATCCRYFDATDKTGVYTAEYLDGFTLVYLECGDTQYELDINTMDSLIVFQTLAYEPYDISVWLENSPDEPHYLGYNVYDEEAGEYFSIHFDPETGRMISNHYEYYDDELGVFTLAFDTETKALCEVVMFGYFEDPESYNSTYPYPSWMQQATIR